MKSSALVLLSFSLFAAANPLAAPVATEPAPEKPTTPSRVCLKICAGPDYKCPKGMVLEKIGVGLTQAIEMTSRG
jgi:hypothetical protein